MAARAKGPGRRFVTTLWSQMSSSDDRYHIDPNVHSYQCDKYANATYSMYAFVLMRRYPWENVRRAPNMISNNKNRNASSSPSHRNSIDGRDVPLCHWDWPGGRSTRPSPLPGRGRETRLGGSEIYDRT